MVHDRNRVDCAGVHSAEGHSQGVGRGYRLHRRRQISRNEDGAQVPAVKKGIPKVLVGNQAGQTPVLDDRRARLEELFYDVEFVGNSPDNPYALEKDVPVFVPAFTDSELGLDFALDNRHEVALALAKQILSGGELDLLAGPGPDHLAEAVEDPRSHRVEPEPTEVSAVGKPLRAEVRPRVSRARLLDDLHRDSVVLRLTHRVVQLNLDESLGPDDRVLRALKVASYPSTTHLASADVQRQFVQSTGLLPTRVAVLSQEIFQHDPFYQRVAAGLTQARAFPAFPLWGLVEKRLTETFTAIWEEILASPAPDIHAIVDQHLFAVARRLNVTLASY